LRTSNGKKKGENNRNAATVSGLGVVEAAHLPTATMIPAAASTTARSNNQSGYRHQGAGLQTGQGRLARNQQLK